MNEFDRQAMDIYLNSQNMRKVYLENKLAHVFPLSKIKEDILNELRKDANHYATITYEFKNQEDLKEAYEYIHMITSGVIKISMHIQYSYEKNRMHKLFLTYTVMPPA